MLLSPRTVGFTEREKERMVDVFIENLRRYLVGTELLSRVTPTGTDGDEQTTTLVHRKDTSWRCTR